MKVLVIHPDDAPLCPSWAGQRWDAAFDLARSGWAACERWSQALGCPVKPIDGIRDGLAEIHKVRELLQWGLGRLVDREGLDWWELTGILVHSRLETLVLLWKFANEVPPDGEVWITREGFEADALELVLGARLHVMHSEAAATGKGFRHYANRLKQLPVAHVLQTIGDKYDAGYRVRRHFHQRQPRKAAPVVLVPSSYINMSLTAVHYASLAPARNFLIVSTRSSGRLNEAPGNVRQAWLASYAGDASAEEHRDLLRRWDGLKKQIESVPELAALARFGLMDDFPRRFADGLAIRNAWLRVLSLEQVEAVLCFDDSNPYTHIPLMLGQKRGLPTIVSHHGALDGRYLIKTCHADTILAKGRMEQDYLVNTCGVEGSLVEIGAPSAPEYSGKSNGEDGDWIVFFSEPYEMSGGRTEEIYRDIVPRLVELAQRTSKTLVLKLHPSENLVERQKLTKALVGQDQMERVLWQTGRFGRELLQRTWFGVTVQSSVAMECIVHGVPCFLCDWLDLWPYRYISQYKKFGVGMGLRVPADIARIPELLAASRPTRAAADSCWEPLLPQRFDEILTGTVIVPSRIQRAQ